MKYEIYTGSNDKFVIRLERWGFLSNTWNGASQTVIDDPNHNSVLKFNSEEEARAHGDKILVDTGVVWEKIDENKNA